MKLARLLAVMLLVSLFGTGTALAQGYPTPRATGSPADACTVCETAFQGLPTFPYSTPIKAYKGRLMDSHATRDYQQPERTYRARRMQYEPATGKFYGMFGSTVAAWSEASLFSKLGGPLTGPPAARAFGGEKYVAPDYTFYAERNSGWQVQVVDGQIRLFDVATDDRGYVYVAYSIFGWGILRDAGSLTSVVQIAPGNAIETPGGAAWTINTAKIGTRYLAIVGWNGGYTVYDVTTPTAMTKLYQTPSVRNSVGDTANTTNFSHMAYVNGATGNLHLVSANGLSTGASPTVIAKSAGNSTFKSVSADSQYFWAVEFLGNSATSFKLWKIRASDFTTETFTLPAPGGIDPTRVDAYNGMVAVASIRQLHFYDATGAVPIEIPVADWFKSFYFNAPAGFARPEQTYMIAEQQGLPHVYQGKTYLIYSTYGMGDVFEVEAGESLDIRAAAGVPYGTQNPKNPNRLLGPYYGDAVTFTSTFSGQITPNVNWNFGNPESFDNTTTTTVGVNVQHRYKGLTSAGAITATKTVRAASSTDPTVDDEESVNLLLPVPRVVHHEGGLVIAPNAPPSGMTVIVGDSFYDGSDGSVESHYGEWNLDGIPATQSPLIAQPVGGCGVHTLGYTARYQQYSGSASITPVEGTSFNVTLPSFGYTAVPFTAKAVISTSNSTTLTFANAGRTSAAAFSGGATWTVQWNVFDANNAPIGVQPNPSVVTVGTVPAFVMNKNEIISGSKVRLTITASAASMAVAGCDTYLVQLSEIPLAPPDPFINTSACTAPTTIGNCTLSADSSSGRDQTGWTYQWNVSPAISLPATRTVSPTFPLAGNYLVTVTATNQINSATSSQATLVVAQPPCLPIPVSTIYYSYTPGAGNTVSFDAKLVGTAYSWQDCDTLTWTWGDGTSATTGNKNTALSVSHTFANSGTFTVMLTVSNTAGASRNYSQSITVGTVVPPPPPPPPPPTGCTAPKAGGVFVGFTGPQSGCKAGSSTPCIAGENVSFKVDTFGYTLQSCDSVSWKFGDGGTGSGQTTAHAYAAGNFTVELRVSNSAGAVTTTAPIAVGAGTCNPPGADIKITWLGLSSGCDQTKTCTPGERVTFFLSSASGYQLQTCDAVSWDFGDGQTSSTKATRIEHTYTSNGPFLVGIAVANSKGTVTDAKTLSFVPLAKPVVSMAASGNSGKPGDTLSFVGTAQSSSTLTGHLWRVLRVVGSSNQVVRTVANEGSISHTFAVEGDYRVEYTASNAGGSSDPAVATVKIANANQFAFLLPVVAHLDGQNNTKWRTDLQIYNTDPLNAPISLEFEFRGGSTQFTKTIVLSASTKVYEDFLSVLVAPFDLDDAGPVIVRGAGASLPQMWTRTYTVDASGIGSYGQLIPAVRLDTAPQSGEAPGSYVVPGLEISSRYRTNLGLVNPSNQPVQATITVTDDSMLGFPIGQFTIDIGPYALTQIGNLASRVTQLSNGKPFSVRIATVGNASLVVYGSMIDQISNDPVYIPGIHESTQAGAEKRIQVVPGAGHIVQGNDTWRSDVVVYNADTVPVKFNLSYFDSAGQKVAEAAEQALGPGAFMRVEDVLRWPLLNKTPPDSFGMIKIETIGTGIVRYPIVLERTYKDRGALGTFGQGIPAISPDRPNVELGKPAFIAGVRSDTSFYTNLGLVAVGNVPSKVRVSLLDGTSGLVVGTWQYVPAGASAPVAITPNQSIIAANIIRALSPTATQGTLKIEVIEGGPVWAYASVIAAADPSCNCTLPNHTFDPEYIPAVRSGN